MTQRTQDWQAIEGVSWKGPPLAAFRAMMREIESKFGPPIARDQDSNGMGLFDWHGLRFLCGLEVVLWRFHLGSQWRPIDPLTEPSWFEIHANERDLEHIGFHLGVAPAAMSLWYDANQRPLASSPAHRCHVMRQDDNGNRFLVSSVSSRCEADSMVRDYEARGHKQTYWVDETP